MSTSVTPADVDAFRRDGVILLRQAFRNWVEPLRRGVDQLMTDPSPLERSVRPADGSAPFFQDLCNWQRIETFRDFVFHSGADQVAAMLMESRTARFFHDHVLVKQPGTNVETPWHQDQPYYCVEGLQSVSFWIPLDPVAREVAMECIRGSHLWGKRFTPVRFDGSRLYAQDDFDVLPDVASMRDVLDVAAWNVEAGDAIAFSFRTLHGAPGNAAATPRRVFSARWVGDDAVYADRGGKGSPPFTGLNLADGDPFEGPQFPLFQRTH